ncbi:MAG: hypothetical protein KJ749_10970, partial [Planctomycetes bacterium]|nr:hypothetical protein [Planctomycetota bacterium]
MRRWARQQRYPDWARAVIAIAVFVLVCLLIYFIVLWGTLHFRGFVAVLFLRPKPSYSVLTSGMLVLSPLVGAFAAWRVFRLLGERRNESVIIYCGQCGYDLT